MLFSQTAQKYINNAASNAVTNRPASSNTHQSSIAINESIFTRKPSTEPVNFNKARMGIFANRVADSTMMDEYVGSKGTPEGIVTQEDNDILEKYEEVKSYIGDEDESDLYTDVDDDVAKKPKEHKIIGVSRDLGTPLNNYFREIASGMYAQSVYDIQHTNYGDRLIRKKKMNKVITETFFYGANRFGNNFIA